MVEFLHIYIIGRPPWRSFFIPQPQRQRPRLLQCQVEDKRHTMGRQRVSDGERIRLVSVRDGQGQVV